MTSTPSLSMLPRPDISGRALSLGLRFVEHYPSPRRPLAPPPAGSGLRPVPGRPGLPYIGYAPMVYDMIPWTRKMFAEFGPVSWSRMFGSDAVYVLGPEAQEVVWLNRDKAFSNELGFDHFTGPFFRRGLLMLDFDEHLHHRRIMQQAFTRPRLLGYLDMLAPAIAEDLAGWQPSDRFRFYTNAKQMLLLNRPGVSGDLSVWEGWVHVGEYVAEVSAGVAGSGGADGRGDPCGSRVGVGGDG